MLCHSTCRRVAPSRTIWAMTGLLAMAAPAGASDIWTYPPVTARALGDCAAPGSFVLPGTDGCLRIGGNLAAGFSATVPAWRGTLARPATGPSPADDYTRTVVQARLFADVRVPTELGPFRAFVSVRNRHGF